MSIKNKFFATTATAALVASAIVPVASAAEFKDAEQIQEWAQEAVEALASEEIVRGDDQGKFNPKNDVTRAEAAEMLYKARNLSTEGTEDFPDVNDKDWFYEAVVATSKAEIFEGNDQGEFRPKDKLTREQAAAVIVRAFNLTGATDLSSFDDNTKVSGWAKAAMQTAVATGVVKGNGSSLNPLDSISRSEMAVMIYRAMEVVEQGDQTPTAKTALETAITTAESVDTTGKTAASVQTLEEAITAAKAVLADVDATDEDYAAAKTAVDEAVAGLVDEEQEEGVAEITSANAYANNSFALALGIFTEYVVEGTVADKEVTEVVLTFTDINGVEVTETVEVTEGNFSKTFAGTDFNYTIASVSFENGEEVVTKDFEKLVK